MKYLSRTTTLCTLLSIILLCLLPLSQHGVQKAEANAVVVVGGNGTIQETISAGANVATQALQNAFYIKEFTLDGIAHGLAKMVLKSMTQSILNWINSGFQGKPAFVTDLKQFLRDRIDETVGEFIYNDPSLNFLCSPFQLDVKIALATSYQQNAHDGFGSKAQCTLSQVTDNVEGFLNGSFNDGGWESWFELTQNPVNTPTGAYLAGQSEMYARIVDEQGRTIKELDWGDGFLSFKVCANGAQTGGSTKNCDITTPGRVIADQINKSLGAGQDELIAADEINEIISALFAQLAKQAITGMNGLLGLGGGSYSDTSFGPNKDQSYLDALKAEDTISPGVGNPFGVAIKREQDNIALQNRIISMITAVETRLNATSSCANLALPAAFVSQRTAAQQRIVLDTTHISQLTTMNTAYTASQDPQAKLDLVTELMQMQQDNTLTTITENSLLKIDIDFDLTEAIKAFNTQIDTAERRCNGGGGGNH